MVNDYTFTAIHSKHYPTRPWSRVNPHIINPNKVKFIKIVRVRVFTNHILNPNIQVRDLINNELEDGKYYFIDSIEDYGIDGNWMIRICDYFYVKDGNIHNDTGDAAFTTSNVDDCAKANATRNGDIDYRITYYCHDGLLVDAPEDRDRPDYYSDEDTINDSDDEDKNPWASKGKKDRRALKCLQGMPQ